MRWNPFSLARPTSFSRREILSHAQFLALLAVIPSQPVRISKNATGELISQWEGEIMQPGQQSVVLEALKVIIVGTNGGLFAYSPSKAAGNLIASIAPVGGTDDVTNVYLAGFVTYKTSVPIVAAQLLAGGITFYSAPSEAGPWTPLGSFTDQQWFEPTTASIQIGGAPPAQLIATLAGIQFPRHLIPTVSIGADPATSADLEIHSLTAIAQSAAPGTPPSGFTYLYANNIDKFLHVKDQSGQDDTIPGTHGDTTQFTVTQAVATQLGNAWSIAANNARVGTIYRIVNRGTATWGSTQQQLSLQQRINSTNVNNMNIAAAAFAVSTPVDWVHTMEYEITQTGAAGLCRVYQKLEMNVNNAAVNTGNSVVGIRRSVSIAIDTTAVNTLPLFALWAAITGAPTITSDGTTFERLGP